jgi:hypothetical protein
MPRKRVSPAISAPLDVAGSAWLGATVQDRQPSAPRASRIYLSLVGKCFCGAIEIAISGSLAKEMAMILNCLAGGANARFLQSAQRNLRGTAGHSQEGLAQGSNRNKQDNTIKQEFGRSPLSDGSNTRTPTNIRIKCWRSSRLDKRANRRASCEVRSSAIATAQPWPKLPRPIQTATRLVKNHRPSRDRRRTRMPECSVGHDVPTRNTPASR